MPQHLIRAHVGSLWLLLAGACTCSIPPTSYAAHADRRRVVIRMDEVLHLMPLLPVLASPRVVQRVLSLALATPGRQVRVVVYYTGAVDYQRASVAAFSLRKLLLWQGYDSTRLAYQAEPSKVPLREKKYPCRRVDFIVTQL